MRKRDAGWRVVEGATHLSPMLGKRMIATKCDALFVRELLPQDLKLDTGSLTIDEAMKAANFSCERIR